MLFHNKAAELHIRKIWQVMLQKFNKINYYIMKTKEELETLKREFMSKIDLDKFKVKQMPNGKYAIIETSSIFNLIIDTNQGYYYQSPKKAVSAYYYKIKNGYDGEILTNIENYFDNYIANIL